MRVGDLVICVNNSGPQRKDFVIGKIYTVLEVHHSGSEMFYDIVKNSQYLASNENIRRLTIKDYLKCISV